MSGKRKIILKIEITLLVFIATLTSLTLAFSPDRAAAPSAVTYTGAPGATVTPPAVPDTPVPSATQPKPKPDPEPEPSDTEPPEPEDKLGDRYVTLGLSESDIGAGDLILVNSEHYYEIPENGGLVLVGTYKSRSYVLLDGNARLAEKIIEPLNAMLDSFYSATGINNILLNSSFRTLSQQQAALDTWVRRIGAEEAKRMASVPGYSEHHTGLAFDLAVYARETGTVSTFKGTGKYAWIHDNAYKFGFVLRYLEDKQDITKTAYEPWHFRYIGLPHSYIVVNKGWAYEEYMEYLMCFDVYSAHLFEVYDGVKYEIYSVSGTDVPVPKDLDYSISGNNAGGFIVTVNHGPADEVTEKKPAVSLDTTEH